MSKHPPPFVLQKIVPPTLNLHRFDAEDVSPNYVINSAQELVRSESTTRLIALTNSFGFGGTNASLCFGEA